MAGVKTALLMALCVSTATLLAGCDNGPSAVAQKQAAGTQMASTSPPESTAPAADGVDHRTDPVALLDGKPMWSASRRSSAEDSAQRAFERNGEAFGAKDIDSFIRKAHAFVENPPKGAETLKRANGDLLIYDPKANVFAVANKDGAPRTMFKPDEGAAYWQEQKDREARRQTARKAARDDDA